MANQEYLKNQHTGTGGPKTEPAEKSTRSGPNAFGKRIRDIIGADTLHSDALAEMYGKADAVELSREYLAQAARHLLRNKPYEFDTYRSDADLILQLHSTPAHAKSGEGRLLDAGDALASALQQFAEDHDAVTEWDNLRQELDCFVSNNDDDDDGEDPDEFTDLLETLEKYELAANFVIDQGPAIDASHFLAAVRDDDHECIANNWPDYLPFRALAKAPRILLTAITSSIKGNLENPPSWLEAAMAAVDSRSRDEVLEALLIAVREDGQDRLGKFPGWYPSALEVLGILRHSELELLTCVDQDQSPALKM